MLRTLLRNDDIAYPWLAPAGVRRGLIENAASLGYLNRNTGEFVPTKTRLGIRDVLYTYSINPLVFFTGNGLLNYGNKTSFMASGTESTSALDRINVARLVAYIRRQLTLIARPFVFEPNDASTRQNISAVIESLMLDLQAKRGIYDYLVVCDETNNFPARIDRNELWVDVAIEPVKAAEFIYIPVRILNTGELSKIV
jgi:phage tail sheath protein FI